MEITKSDIEKLKTTWTAFGGLSKNEQEFLRQNAEDLHKVNWRGMSLKVSCAGFYPSTIYRLRPDFELPVERWFYCNDLMELSNSNELCPECVEVPPDLLDYVLKYMKRANIKEFELRIPCVGEKYIKKFDGNMSMMTAGMSFKSPRFCRRKVEKPWLDDILKKIDALKAEVEKMRGEK